MFGVNWNKVFYAAANEGQGGGAQGPLKSDLARNGKEPAPVHDGVAWRGDEWRATIK